MDVRDDHACGARGVGLGVAFNVFSLLQSIFSSALVLSCTCYKIPYLNEQ